MYEDVPSSKVRATVLGVVHVVMTCPNGMSLLVIGAHNALGLIVARATNARDLNMVKGDSVMEDNKRCCYSALTNQCQMCSARGAGKICSQKVSGQCEWTKNLKNNFCLLLAPRVYIVHDEGPEHSTKVFFMFLFFKRRSAPS